MGKLVRKIAISNMYDYFKHDMKVWKETHSKFLKQEDQNL